MFEATVPISVASPATVVTLAEIPATVVTSLAIPATVVMFWYVCGNVLFSYNVSICCRVSYILILLL